MEDLLKKQIHDNCKLSLPEGLKDLMADISREVLRYQPPDIYKFIADYLAALLVARENLTVTTNVCSDVCNASCNPELEDELRYIGLDETNCIKAVNIIKKHFDTGKVVECNLLQTLVRKIENIDDYNLPKVKKAIVNAFIRHKANATVIYEWSSSDTEEDEVAHAAHHTMKLYRKTAHSMQVQHVMAKRIQAAYRAYNLRMALCIDKIRQKEQIETKIFKFHESDEDDNENVNECNTKEVESPAESHVSSKVSTPDENHEISDYITTESKIVAFHHETESIEFRHPDLDGMATTYEFDTEIEVRSSMLARNGINHDHSDSDDYDHDYSSDDADAMHEEVHKHNEDIEIHELYENNEMNEQYEDSEINEQYEDNDINENYEDNEIVEEISLIK